MKIEISVTAERLRLVKSAYQEFIVLGTLTDGLEKKSVADRIYKDMQAVKDSGFCGRSDLFRCPGYDE